MVTLPIDPSLSKNRSKTVHYVGKKAIIRLSQEYKTAKTYYTQLMRNAFQNYPLRERVKLMVHIHMYKQDNRMDCINFVDGLCDALQDAIKINDRYYSLSIDWSIDKTYPRFEMEISQEWIKRSNALRSLAAKK